VLSLQRVATDVELTLGKVVVRIGTEPARPQNSVGYAASNLLDERAGPTMMIRRSHLEIMP
jgi:hypothetical protein